MTLGERIRTRRKGFGWTLDDLADHTGLSKTFLCQLERGKRRPSADSLLSLSIVLGISMDGLMDSGGNRGSQAIPIDFPKSLQTWALGTSIPFRHIRTLVACAKILIGDRDAEQRLEAWPWGRFHAALRPWLED